MRHPFVPITISFAVGVLLASWLDFSPGWVLAACGGLGATALVLAFSGRRRASIAFVLAAFLWAGAFRMDLQELASPPAPATWRHEAPVPVRLRGRVLEAPLPPAGPAGDQGDRDAGRLLLRVESIESEGAFTDFQCKVLLDCPHVPDILPGDAVEVLAAVRKLSSAWGRRLRRKGIPLVGRVTAPGLVRRLSKGSALSPRRLAARLRVHLLLRLREALPAEEAALFSVLLLGHREAIEPPLRGRFASSGTGHLLAVSGLHLTILAALAGALLKFAGVGRRPRSAILACLAVTYAMLAGGRAPVVRAAVMVTVYLAAEFFGRERDLANTVAIAAFLLILWNPGELHDVGFQLSFAAVWFIASFYPRLGQLWRRFTGGPEDWMEPLPAGRLERFLGRARQAMFVSLAAWLGVQPLLVHYMGLFNPWGVLANLIVLPVATVCLGTGAVLVAAGGLWAALAVPAALPARAALHVMLFLVDFFAGLPFSRLYLPSPGAAWLGAYYALALALVLWPARSRVHRYVLAACGAGLLLGCLVPAAFPRRAGAPSATFFRIGRGRVACLSSGAGGNVLVNAGAHPRDLLGEKLSAVVLTDTDSAHAGSLGRIASAHEIGCLFLPPGRPSEQVRRALRSLAAGGTDIWTSSAPGRFTSSAGFELAWGAYPPVEGPGGRKPTPSRDWRLLAAKTGDDFKVLMAEPAARSDPAHRGRREPFHSIDFPGPCDVLAFLPDRFRKGEASAIARAAGPRLIVLCLTAGEGGFTTTERLVQELTALGVPLLRTDELGTVRIRRAGGRLVVERLDGRRWEKMLSLRSASR